MKKNLRYSRTLILLSAMMLTACNATDDLGSTEVAEGIRFIVDSESSETRGQVYTSFPSDGFHVYGWKQGTTDSPLIDANTIRNSSGYWITETYAIWPEASTTVDFYAVYPKTTVVDNNRQIDYGTPASATDQTDMMYAATFSQNKEINGEDGVALNFRHAMSTIDFKARQEASLKETTDGPNLISITIHSLEIHNVALNATFTMPSANTTGDTPESYGTWNTASSPGTVTLGTSTSPVTLTSTASTLSTSKGKLQLIPQSCVGWNPNETITANNERTEPGCYMKIGCIIKIQKPETDTYTYYVGTNDAIPGYIYFPMPVTWDQGKRHTYLLTFGGGKKDDGTEALDLRIRLQCSTTIIDDFSDDNDPDADIANGNPNEIETSASITTPGSGTNDSDEGYEGNSTMNTDGDITNFTTNSGNNDGDEAQDKDSKTNISMTYTIVPLTDGSGDSDEGYEGNTSLNGRATITDFSVGVAEGDEGWYYYGRSLYLIEYVYGTIVSDPEDTDSHEGYESDTTMNTYVDITGFSDSSGNNDGDPATEKESSTDISTKGSIDPMNDSGTSDDSQTGNEGTSAVNADGDITGFTQNSGNNDGDPAYGCDDEE